VCVALENTRDDIAHPWMAPIPIQPDDHDEQWLPIVGQNRWIILMRDKRIRYNPLEQSRLLGSGCAAFCLTGNLGQAKRWEVLSLLTSKWDQIEHIAANTPWPFIQRVTWGPIRPWLP